MTSFEMLYFLHLIKYSQINVNMSHSDYIFFLFLIFYFFLMYLCSFVWCLMDYDIYL